MEIRTARLLLRRPRPDDLEPLYSIMSNPLAMRYWSTLPHANTDVTRIWLDAKLARNAAGGEDFLIVYEGKVIGEVGASRLPEFGFILHPDFWGRGMAYEAASAFLSHAFSTTNTPEVTADVDPRNHASLDLLARLGFVETGRAARTFLLGDEWCDSVYLRLARPSGPSDMFTKPHSP
ncbi:GNAT family N-acetyltransferase [Devosia ureilytica]|nr:GNAT family N-acetyltransferase [Devosia ureilytica]